MQCKTNGSIFSVFPGKFTWVMSWPHRCTIFSKILLSILLYGKSNLVHSLLFQIISPIAWKRVQTGKKNYIIKLWTSNDCSKIQGITFDALIPSSSIILSIKGSNRKMCLNKLSHNPSKLGYSLTMLPASEWISNVASSLLEVSLVLWKWKLKKLFTCTYLFMIYCIYINILLNINFYREYTGFTFYIMNKTINNSISWQFYFFTTFFKQQMRII